MPNTLTIVFTSIPSSQPVEFQNPNNPGVYTTGMQQANGTWQAIFTGVTKGTYAALTARLKNFPAITATIATSVTVVNIVPNAPLGTSAIGTSTGISVTASTSPNGLANRILASGSGSVGTFAQIYQGAASNYTHLLAAGTVQYYQYQYVGDGGFYDDSLLSLVFSGTAIAAAAPVVLTPALANFSFNVRNSTDSPPHSALASLFVQVSGAAYVDVEYTNTRAVPAVTASGQADPYGVAVNSLGAYDTSFLASGVGTLLVSRLTFSNAASGLRQFVEGVQERNSGDIGAVSYTQITKLTFPAGSTAVFQPPTAGTDSLLVLGDSKSVGVYATGPQTAWISRLRAKRPTMDIYSDGWGYRRASVALLDAPTRAVLITNAVRLGVKRYVVALGTNDRGAGLDPATVMALVSAMGDELHAQLPSLIFYVELEYNTGATGVNSNTAWRTAAQNSKGARGDWYRLIDPGFPSLADGTHANDTGQLSVSSAYDAQLDLIPTAPVLATPVYLHAYDANNTPALWYDNGAGAQNAKQATVALQPSIVAGALFGKAAYYFAPGTNHYMDMAPLAASSQAYTIIMTLRSVVAARDQFYLDIQTGRIVLIAGGWGGVATTNQAAYYTAPGGTGQTSGARGNTMPLVGDSFIALALDSTGSNLYLNGNLVGTYPVGVTAISTGPRIGAAFDITAGSMTGQFQGYIGLVEIHPTKLSATDVEARRTNTGSVITAPTGFLEDGLLTYSGYTTTASAGVTTGPAPWPSASAQGGTHDGIVHYTNVVGATAQGIGWGTVVSWVGTGGNAAASSATFNVINVATGAVAYTTVVDLSLKSSAMQPMATSPTLPFGQYQAQLVVNNNYANVDGFNFA